MKVRLLLVLCLHFLYPGGATSAEKSAPPPDAKPGIVEYFLRLPKDTLEAPPKAWLTDAGIDRANGFIAVAGDGAQPSFQVVLFRFRDGTPLLALGEEQLESESSRLIYLRFFTQAWDGNMREVKRSEFPEKAAQHHYFELPHHGRTIVVRDERSGRVLQRLTWDGSKFQPAQ